MKEKLFHAKYLAIFLLGIFIVLMISFEAFAQSEIALGGGDTAIMQISNDPSISARIDVTKTLRSKNYDLNDCKFGVKLKNQGEEYYARCLTALVTVYVVNRQETINGKNKDRTIQLDLDFFPMTDLKALNFGLSGVEFNNGVLKFKSADFSQVENVKLTLKLTRSRAVFKDVDIFHRELKTSEMTMTAKLADGSAEYAVDLDQLSGGFDSSKKHLLTLSLETLKSVNLKDVINTPKPSNSLVASLVIND